MAPGSKKQKKTKSKKTNGSQSGLSRIASTLVPSAIFAAVPRTSSSLSQTWPRRSPSPLEQAIGEAGNVGRVLIGDLSKRPRAELPSVPGENGDERSASADRQGNEHDRDEKVREDWEDDYETVHGSKKFDKTTKYHKMTKEGTLAVTEEMEGATAENGGEPSQHFYHVLDHDSGQVVQPVYSRVDKRKKSAAKQSVDGDKEEKESLSEVSYSSDELTDVTSHDEESTTSGSRAKRSLDFGGRRRSRKGSREESHDGQDIVDGPGSHSKKGSTKQQTPDTIQEVSEDAGEEGDGAAPPPIPPYLEDTSPEAPERRRRSRQRSALDQLDGPGEPLPPIPGDPPENRLTDEQRRALKVVERLGFEGVSQKLALSDLSEDSESYMTPVVPKNTIDFNGKTTFEREQFNDTLTESNVPVSEATIVEANLSLGQTFSGLDGYELQEELQSPNEQAQRGKHLSFKTQAGKANKVSSFVNLLNAQERHRQAERSSNAPVKGRRDPSPNQSGGSSKDSQGFVDPFNIQRLEEARQANETSFLERQQKLEKLVEQQQNLYQEQLEQQKIQQQQQQEVVRQQWKLQEQLRALEKMQQEFNENADLSLQGPAVSESDVRLQRQLVRQQQEFLQKQQEQLQHSQNQQARALEQQEKLCEQIGQLEEQQRQLQSSVSLLSPAGEDLAEIKQQEQQIVNLLNEQRRQESELQRLHQLQQRRLEEQSNSFTHERKALEQNQEMLQGKIKEQETRRMQLEEELEEMRRKHVESEEQWKKRLNAVSVESSDRKRMERLDRGDDHGYGEKRLDERNTQGNVASSYQDKKGRKSNRATDDSPQFDDVRHALQSASQSSNLSYRDEIEGRRDRHKQRSADSSRHVDREGRWSDGDADSPKHGKRVGRKAREKGERNSRKTRMRSAESEPVITKTDAEITRVQVVRDDEVYRLSKGRIELLESEKSAMMELNTSLQEENKALKQLSLSLQKGTGVSSVVLQKQIKDLHQEQKVLRDTVHRLNVELSRYQAKYRPVSFEEVEGMALPYKKEAAPWLVNTKFLAPLFLAYDDRLREKEQMIRTYDEELNSFKARVMEVVKENQQLHMSISKASPDALGPDEWQQLQEQAKLVVEENALLMEQQEIQDKKMKEMKRIHGLEVSKLSKRISSQESTRRRLETELDDMRRTHNNLMRQHEAMVADQENKMLIQEHLRIMDECRSVLEDLKAKTKSETEEYNSKLQAVQKEKSNLAIKFADGEAKSAQLERELDAYKKSLQKSERKFLFLQRKLEHIQERELTAQETLSQVLTIAEKTAAERDNYVQFAKTQKAEQQKAASKILAGTQNIKGLEEKLQEYRRKATDKVAIVTGRLREKETEINKLKEQYEGEINNLRAVVRQKQRQLELMIGDNRNVDKELEKVWKTAAADNRRMKDTVRQKGGMFDSDSDPNAHLSSEEGEAA